METLEKKGFVYEFGKFMLDPNEKTLFSDGLPVRLRAKEFETLLLLVENNGKALTKEQMMASVWQDTFVEESNLAKQISKLRKIFNTNGDRLIETLPKHGYRFSADLQRTLPAVHEPVIFEKRTLKRLTIAVETETGAQPLALPPEPKRIARLPLAAALGLIVFLIASVWYLNREAQPASAKVNTIAVMPMRPLSDEESSKALGLGLTDALITKLGGLRQIIVRPTSAVVQFADAPVDSLEIGRKLNADTVLEGTIQQADGRLRVNARLLSTESGEQIWGETFYGEFTNILDVEDRISEQAAQALMLALGSGERPRLTKRHTRSPEAFDAYLKGRYFLNKRTEEGFRQAASYFEQAVSKDGDYALAYVGLADCYTLLGVWGSLPPNDAMPKAKAAALKALEADDALAEAHASLAFVKWVYDWDRDGADRGFRRAIELNPNYATAHHWRAYYLAAMKRFDESILHIRKAQEIEGPLAFGINTDIGEIYCWAGQYDRAAEHLQTVIGIEPTFAMARNTLGITYIKSGRQAEALTELEAARLLDNGPRMISSLGYAYGASGQPEKARQIIAELRKLSEKRYVSSFAVAIVHLGLGEHDAALSLLEKAYDERSDTMAIMTVYPLLDDLRGDPRFVALSKRVGLVP